MDQLVHKLEFEGPSISFSSRHLAVGVASLDDDAAFNGTTFSAVLAPNASEPQVPLPPSPPCPLVVQLGNCRALCRDLQSLRLHEP